MAQNGGYAYETTQSQESLDEPPEVVDEQPDTSNLHWDIIRKHSRGLKAAKHVHEASKKLGVHAKVAYDKHSTRLVEAHRNARETGDFSHYHIVWPYALLLLALLMALIFVCRLFFCRRVGKARGRAPRAVPLPFDVEGGGNALNGATKVLHPSISQAAKTADVAALRQWLHNEHCFVNAALAVDASTALHAAAGAGHANVVRLLLDGGADPLVVDSELRTPLHLVASAGHGLCVKALLDAGADPEGRDGQGETPLSIAEGQRHMGTARMMRVHLERQQADDSSLRRAR